MKKQNLIINFLFFIVPFLLDRITKHLALNGFFKEYKIDNFLAFELSYNRGISWGALHSDNKYIFIILSSFILIIICFLIWHIIHRIRKGKIIYGELLIISGAISNFIDRIIYGGVIDFILIYYKNYSWPVFNIADTCIVLGVIIMFFTLDNN